MQTSFTQSISPWTTNFYSYKPTAMLSIFQLDELKVCVYKWYLGLTCFPVYIWSYFWIVISSFVIRGNRKCYRWLICPNCSTQHNKSTLLLNSNTKTNPNSHKHNNKDIIQQRKLLQTTLKIKYGRKSSIQININTTHTSYLSFFYTSKIFGEQNLHRKNA